MEPTNGQLEPAVEEKGGLVTRERHVFKVPAPKSSLLGEAVLSMAMQLTGMHGLRMCLCMCWELDGGSFMPSSCVAISVYAQQLRNRCQ